MSPWRNEPRRLIRSAQSRNQTVPWSQHTKPLSARTVVALATNPIESAARLGGPDCGAGQQLPFSIRATLERKAPRTTTAAESNAKGAGRDGGAA